MLASAFPELTASLMHTLPTETLRVALEALAAQVPRPVLLVDASARVLVANTWARAWLGEGRAHEHLRDAIAGRGSIFEVTVLGRAKRAWLLVAPRQTTEARVDDAARRWRLTNRQRDVLGLLVRGLANKEIAEALEVSLATVEAHVTAVLRAAGVDSRVRLVSLVSELAPLSEWPRRSE